MGTVSFLLQGGELLFRKVGVSPLSIYPDFESWPLLVGFCFDPSLRGDHGGCVDQTA